MTDASAVRIPLQLLRGCVVASIQIELNAEVLTRFQRDLLDLVHRSGARTVVIDLAGLDIVDPEDFEGLKRAASMARIMGARSIFAGIRPGVVSALVDLGVEMDADHDGIRAALDLDDAFRILDLEREPEPEAEPAGEEPPAPEVDGDPPVEDAQADRG